MIKLKTHQVLVSIVCPVLMALREPIKLSVNDWSSHTYKIKNNNSKKLAGYWILDTIPFSRSLLFLFHLITLLAQIAMPKSRKEGRKHRHKEYNREADSGSSPKPAVSDATPAKSFDDLNLKPDLLRGIYSHGFERPSAIQQRAIRPILRGRDVIAQSVSILSQMLYFQQQRIF